MNVVDLTIEPAKHVLCFIRGTVIDYDDFKRGVGLCEHAFHGLSNELARVICRNDGAYETAGISHCLSISTTLSSL